MKIDLCLIMSAGHGSRMGEVGRVLPKPLWPLGRKALIERQYDLATSVNLYDIYVNTHHGSESINDYVGRNNLSIKILHEEELLDVGGTVQKLVNLGLQGNCLILNCDQVMTSGQSILKKVLNSHHKNNIATLGAIELLENEKYNRFDLRNGDVVCISSFGSHREDQRFTYAGIGVINLSLIQKTFVNKKANLFDLIFRNKKERRIELSPIERGAFFDVGTKENFVKFCFESLSDRKLDWLDLGNCYKNDFFNFSDTVWSAAPKGSVILGGEQQKLTHRCLYYNGVIDRY